MEVPIVRLLFLKDLDRASPQLLIGLIAIIFVFAGLFFSFMKLFALIGGFTLLVYLIFMITVIWNR